MISDDPGAVYVKQRVTGEETRHYILKSLPDGRLPAVSRPPGLPAARQGYLYERIRSYVTPEMRDFCVPAS